MILALDGSSARGSVALLNAGEIVRECEVETPRGRGGALFAGLKGILRGGETITRVVAGTGPGSYNGIRSTLAAAWGLATARGVPLVGISSLLGLGEGAYCAAGDARRGQFYFARVSGDRFVWKPELYDKEGLLKQLAQGSEEGNAAPLYVPEEVDCLPQAIVRTANAARLGRLAGKMAVSDSAMPLPLYLKPAFINTAGRVN